MVAITDARSSTAVDVDERDEELNKHKPWAPRAVGVGVAEEDARFDERRRGAASTRRLERRSTGVGNQRKAGAL
jgi:hypothetical protein